MKSSPGQKNTAPTAITMGCPVGIGPEIILRLFTEAGPWQELGSVVVGDAGVLARAAEALGLPAQPVAWVPGASPASGRIPVLSLTDLGPDLRWGKPNADTGRAMGCYIEEAVRRTLAGEFSAVVTCPISKAALQAGGYPFPGHTEMLAKLCGGEECAMMMVGSRLRVTLVTIHQALAEIASSLSVDAVLRMIRITGRALLHDFGLVRPRLAVAGFNPHAGEGGLFGTEEERIIQPAIEAARREGWLVEGPFPPDTVYHRAAAGHYDAVVSMYHDQGLIPFKLLHFSDGVNVTLGLPLVRTSVDHGTAYDIAGRGLAAPSSLAAAFVMAKEIVANRRKGREG